jgi:hypothetical protein
VTYPTRIAYLRKVKKVVFKKILELADLPSDWSLVSLSVDWEGQPLVLAAEGKPKRPEPPCDADTWVQWQFSQPKAHHLIYFDGGSVRTIRFQQSQGQSTFHVQPFGEGWLLGERRGHCGLYDRVGHFVASLDLGDASEDLQTTPDGMIWVSYFDEGVFGGGIGSEGLVCFDTSGVPVFRYVKFAEQNNLPFICDCYAMNVSVAGDVWLNYYTDFPLVHLRNLSLEKVWRDFGSMGNGFAIAGGASVYTRGSQLMSRPLDSSHEETVVDARDETGSVLVPIAIPHLGFVARGPSLVVNNGKAIYGSAL